MRCQRKFPESSQWSSSLPPRRQTIQIPGMSQTRALLKFLQALNHSEHDRAAEKQAADAFTQTFCGSGDVALFKRTIVNQLIAQGDPELRISLILAFGTGDAVLCTSLNTAAAQSKPTAKTSIMLLQLQLRHLSPQAARTLNSGRRPNDGERCHMASQEYSQIISSFRWTRSSRVQAEATQTMMQKIKNTEDPRRFIQSHRSTLHCPHSVCSRSSAPAPRWL